MLSPSRRPTPVPAAHAFGGAPPPLPDELGRPALVGRLAQRWNVPVTVVVAGPGFGKSTSLAQAVRAGAACPVGDDAWLTCEPRHERAADLAAAIVAALDGDQTVRDPLAAILDALRLHAPLDVCLVLDDVHHLGGESSAARLLGDVVRRLPSNAHLVLASRTPPPIPLARLRAAERLVEIGEDELAFDHGEIERLAARLDRPAGGCASRLAGWPALVRVCLAARPDAALGYAREEVIATLSPADRRTLLALATVGSADDDVIGGIVEDPVPLAELATHVPLVRAIDDTRFNAHELWLDALRRTIDPTEARAVRTAAVGELTTRGELAAAGEIALADGDWRSLGRVALELVRTTVSVLPVELAARWLATVPESERSPGGAPELRLLDAAVRATIDHADPSVDMLVDETADAFRARGDAAAEVVSLALGTVAAQSRGDTDRLVSLALRTSQVPGAGDHAVVVLAARSIAGVVAEMQGDPERALEEFAGARLDDVPPPLALSANRFLMHCLLLAGRADDAVAVADRALTTVGNIHSQRMPAFTRWHAGDPSGLDELLDGHLDPACSARDLFLAAAFNAVIGASAGRRERFEERGVGCARDAAVLANARAAHAVLDHDEQVAANAIVEFLDQHGDDRAGERHLRRFLALGYVLDAGLRARWDAAPFGPSHLMARRIARLLIDLRAGKRRTLDGLALPAVFTVLPLPWAAELACRLHGTGAPDGLALAAWLLDRLGSTAQAEIRRLATHGDANVACQAAAVLAQLPVAPDGVVEIAVLGPLAVHRDGVPINCAELRRARVRELLAVLVLEPTLPRDRAVDLLWPELDVDAGQRNLRVTLTYLRRVLEPDRPAGEASYHLRADADAVRLVASPALRVDLWDLRRLTGEATAARRAGDVERAAALLDEATRHWRGAPLRDLDRVAGFDAEIEQVRLLQVASLLELGTLRLTMGESGAASAAAEQVLAIEPYAEAAHRLAIAASAHRHDRARVAAAVERAERALDELGVDPEPATLILLRAAGERRSNLTARVALAS